MLFELRELGFSLLAAVLEDRKIMVRVEGHDISTLIVRFPYSEAVVEAIRSVPGRRWSREDKAWLIPATQVSRAALWTVLKKHYPGEIIKTETGLKTIPIA